MGFRAPPIRSILTQDTSSVCSQCWRKLLRRPTPCRQPFSNMSSSRHAVAVGKRRNSFSKDYFWTNSTLRETLGQSLARSRRDIQSSIASARVGTAAPARSPEQPEHAETSEDVLPHRRRKRRRELESTENTEQSYPIALDASAQLADISSKLPQRSLKRVFTTYLSLSKPRLSFLVVLTATAAYSLYPVPGLLAPAATATPSLSTLTLFFLTSGTALCSASANAFNMLMEPEHDAKMSRTRNRPLVRKLISTRGAMVFAVACGALGTGALYYGVNPTTAFLGFTNIVLYAGCYTPLKRMHVLNTWIGAIVGGIPPLMGWTAAAGQCAHDGTWQELLFGENSAGGWLCAALLFAWQFPHFNSLSWSIREEYKYAGYRMLAWVNPAQNGRVALRYAVLMFPVCIGLSLCGVTDMSFIATSSVVNGWMVWKAVDFWREQGHKGTARGLFWASVWHLPIVMVLAMAQKKGLGERVYRSIFGYADDEDDLYYEVGQFEEEEEKVKAVVERGSTA
ncbi:Protoheme IX farnesyltransferase, mitochondrial [Paraphaeosphaeria sporulosa]|uniref:Protoheme IX farnesyltransferase, mitochondrial n=1 Tax=Paraphaeosphaeria sporulosa TaxID=1460663 RepID=A0A177CT88_9PLEO|nr:mitochondria protoheme IX farnesyltransferase [Paraphaeosphaeria sporulosa]OAG10411.1 mitochondria protoheme IX farnesyltransferase [Paraphaeosphaeria sporulosa]